MVSRCFNLACSAPFHSLERGTVFRLEPDRGFRNPTAEPEYFWLCQRCEATMTLTLDEDGTVTIPPGPPPYAQGIRRDMPLAFNRSKGLLLRSIGFLPRPSTTASDR